MIVECWELKIERWVLSSLEESLPPVTHELKESSCEFQTVVVELKRGLSDVEWLAVIAWANSYAPEEPGGPTRMVLERTSRKNRFRSRETEQMRSWTTTK